MGLEEAGLSLSLDNADKVIAQAKQTEQAFTGLLTALRNFSSLSGASTPLDNLSQSFTTFNKSAQEAIKAAQDAGSKLSDMGQKAQSSAAPLAISEGKTKSLASELISLGGNAATAAANGLGKVASAAGGALVSGLEKAASVAEKVGASVLQMGVHAVESGAHFATSFGGNALQKFQDFDQQLGRIKAVSGATEEQLKAMSDQALYLGAKFPVSAKEAADGMYQLTTAGMSAEDALKASTGVVTLASAGQLEMGRSAEILSASLNGFGLAADQANHVTDLLAVTANKSAVEITDIGSTMKYVGSVAHAAGYSIEDMSLAIGLMGNAGIKGTQAGTSLRSIITRLAAPPAQAADAIQQLGLKITDASGKMLPFRDVLDQMRDKFKGLSQADQIDLAKKIAGQNAMSGLLSLINADQGAFDDMAKAVDNADGAGKRMSDTMNNTLAGAVKNMQGSIETLQIKFGKALAPAARVAADAIAELANRAGPVADFLGKILLSGLNKAEAAYSEFHAALTGKTLKLDGGEVVYTQFTHLGEAVLQLIAAFEKIGDIFSLTKGLSQAGDAAKSAQGPFDLLANGISKIANFLSNNAAGIVAFAERLGSVAEKAWAVYNAFSPLTTAFQVFQGFLQGGIMGALGAFDEKIIDVGKVFGVNLTGPVQEFEHIVSTVFATVGEFLQQHGQQILDFVVGAWNTAAPIVEGVVTTIYNVVSTVFTAISGFLHDHGQQIWDTLVNAWNTAAAVVSSVVNVISQVVSVFVDAVNQFLRDHGLTIQDVINAAWNGILNVINGVSSAIQNIIVPIFNGIANFISENHDTIVNVITTVWNTVYTVVSTVVTAVQTVIETVVSAVVSFWEANGDQIMSIATTIWNAVYQVVSVAINAISGIIQTVAGAISSFWQQHGDQILSIAQTIWNAVQTAISTAMDVIHAVISAVASAIQYLWDNFGQTILSVAQNAWNAVSGVIQGVVGIISGLIGGLIDFVTGAWDKLGNDIQQVMQGAWDAVTSAVRGAVTTFMSIVQGIADWFSNLGGQIMGWLGSIPGMVAQKAGEIGNAIIQGIVNAVKAGAGMIVDAVKSVVSAPIDVAKGILGIHSPSKVFQDIGNQIVMGLILGLTDSKEDGQAAMDGLLTPMNQKALEAAAKQAESLSKIAQTTSAIADSLNKVRNWVQVGKGSIDAFRSDMGELTGQFVALSGQYSEKMVEGAAKFAESSSKVAQTVSTFATALNAVRNWGVVGKDSIFAFTQDMFSLVADFYNISQYFTPKMLGAAGMFANTASTVADAAGKMATALNAVRNWAVVGKDAIFAFAQDSFSLVAEYFNVSKYFTSDMLSAADAFANTAGKVASASSSMATALKALVGYSAIGKDVIFAFAQDVFSLTAEFFNNSRYFKDDMLKAATAYAETAGKVADAVGKSAVALASLKTYSAIGKDTIFTFTQNMLDVVAQFVAASGNFSPKALAGGATFAEALSKMVVVIKPGVDGLTALQNFKSVASSQIDLFVQNMDSLVIDVIAQAGKFDQKAVTAGAAFSEGVGKIVSGFKAGVDLFKGLEQFQGIPSAVIQAFIDDINLTVSLAARMAERTDKELLAQVALFGEAVGKLFSGFKSAMDVFNGLLNFKSVASTVIQAFIGDIILTVNEAAQMAALTNKDLLGKATDFATAVDAIFSKFKSAMDVFKGIGDMKGNPSANIKQVIDGMNQAISDMGQANQQAKAFEKAAQDFADTMQRAADDISKGLNSKAAADNAKNGAGSSNNGSGSGSSANPPGKASGGTIVQPGIYKLAEQGAELLQFANGGLQLIQKQSLAALPGGTVVYNARETQQILASLSMPATAAQISSFYSSSSNSNSTQFIDNRSYSMPLNVAPMPIGSVQQGYTTAKAMLPS